MVGKRVIGICLVIALLLLTGCSNGANVTGEETGSAAASIPESTAPEIAEQTEPAGDGKIPEQTEPTGDGKMPDMNGGRGNGMNAGGGNGGGNGISMSGGVAENSEEVQAVLDANSSKFQQFTFTEESAGVSFEYSLYIPEDYDEAQSYPLILFIPDSTGTGKTARQLVEQYYGATVWATDEEQAKHASFVLVPAYTKTAASDDATVSDEVEATVTLLEQLQETYSIDGNRLYTTGQSGGCMSSFYFNATYPDLFAASLYVSGQWDVSVLSVLEEQKFFYIAAGGDEKASAGQAEVMAMFDSDGVSYSYGTWNAQNSSEEQNNAVAELLSEGLSANMILFETGTVFKEGQSGMEHMYSFNYGYNIEAVRDWLFEQVKTEA